MLAAGAYEPARLGARLLGREEREVAVWERVVDELEDLVGKVASVESAAGVVGCRGEGRPHFSRKNLVAILGEETLEAWVQHYSLAAAACHALSRTVALVSEGRFEDVKELDESLDAQSEGWALRRKGMYEGFKR